MANRIIQTRINAAKRQVNTLKEFLSTPKGVFETADQIVKNFRRANRETLSAIGVRVPSTSLGALGMKLGARIRKVIGGI